MCVIRYRSLKVPGSDSSALHTKYLGTPSGFAKKLHFKPVGNPAPPRPLRPDVLTCSTTSSQLITFITFSTTSYPPFYRYTSKDLIQGMSICLSNNLILILNSL